MIVKNKMTEGHSGVICAVCGILISIDTAFCPNCGHAVFKDGIFYNKLHSTSQYDPFGRSFKPWRDKPLVKKRKYAVIKEKPLPWYPTMRQPRKPRRDVLILKNSPISLENSDTDKETTLADNEEISCEVNISNKFGKQESKSYEDLQHEATCIETSPTVLEKHIPRDRMYPLVAYDLSTERENFTLFISLLESIFADSSTKVYWLKLALLTGLEMDACDVDCSANSKISILGYFSNSVGRLTIPNSDDWVELSSINAKEHYMAQYMQKVLNYICPLINYREDLSCDGDLLYEVSLRNLSLLKEFKDVEHVDDYGRSQISRQTLQILCACRDGPQTIMHNQFCVDDRIATFSCQLRLTRSVQFPFCPVQVHVRVEYRNCISINPQLNPRSMYRDEFLESVKATHLILRIQPDISCFNLSLFIPIATFTFDHIVLLQLLKREPALNDVIEASCDNLAVLEHYITSLVNMLRLENTDDGPKYSLVGAFLEPTFTSLPWPRDVEQQLSTYAAIDDEIEEETMQNLPVDKSPCCEEVDETFHSAPATAIVENLQNCEGHANEVDHFLLQTGSKDILLCPFHLVDDCKCYQCDLTIRGTPLVMFIDFGSVVMDWSSEESFRNCWVDTEEVYLSVVDITGGKAHCWQDDHYLRGKISILPLKRNILDSIIEEFAWSFEEFSTKFVPDLKHFVATLSNHLDLFKSESHNLLKLSAK